MSRDELLGKYQTFYQMSNDEIDSLCEQIRQLKLSKNQINEFLEYLIDQSLHDHNKQLTSVVRLFYHLYKQNYITKSHVIEVFSNILSKIHHYEKEFALFKSELAAIVAHLLWFGLVHPDNEGLLLFRRNL